MMDLGEDEEFQFKHPYFFENFTFKFVGFNPETQRDFENTVKSMGAKVFDDAEYILTDILHASSDLKNYYSLSYLLDSMEAETPLEIEEYKFANLVLGISQSKFCCLNAKYIWKNKSCLSYYNENICCKSCIRTREQHCDELSEESNNLCFNQVNGETNSSNINNLHKESQCANIDDLDEEFQCVNTGDLNEELQRVNIDDSDKESQCANIGDLDEKLQCANIGDLDEELQRVNTDDLNKESQCVNIVALNEQINSLQENENFDSLAMYDNSDENLNDVAEHTQTNGVSQENGASKNNSESSDIEIVEVHVNEDLEKPSCSTQKSKDSKTHKRTTIHRRKRVKKITSDSDTSSKNEDSCNSKKRSKISKTNKPSTIDRWKKKRMISSDSETSYKSEESEGPTRSLRKRKSKRQKLTSSPSPETETVTNKSSSDCEYIPSSEASSSNPSSNEEQGFVIRTNSNKKDWWLDLPPPEISERSGVNRKRDYEYHEKRIMLAYLIVNNLIDDGTSRKPWKKMHEDGYLTDRTIESLNNHFRKTLLPNIESFNLPRNIQNRFKKCRKCHTSRKKNYGAAPNLNQF